MISGVSAQKCASVRLAQCHHGVYILHRGATEQPYSIYTYIYLQRAEPFSVFGFGGFLKSNQTFTAVSA